MDAPRELAQLAQRAVDSSSRAAVEQARGGVGIVSSLRSARLSWSDSATRRCWAPSWRSRSRRRRSKVETSSSRARERWSSSTPGPQLGLQALVVEGEAGGRGHRADELGLLDERLLVDDGPDERAVVVPRPAPGADLVTARPDPAPAARRAGRPR